MADERYQGLNKRHGFFHVIQRNQLSRDSYHREEAEKKEVGPRKGDGVYRMGLYNYTEGHDNIYGNRTNGNNCNPSLARLSPPPLPLPPDSAGRGDRGVEEGEEAEKEARQATLCASQQPLATVPAVSGGDPWEVGHYGREQGEGIGPVTTRHSFLTQCPGLPLVGMGSLPPPRLL